MSSLINQIQNLDIYILICYCLEESNKELMANFCTVKDISQITNISDIIITTTPSDKALID